MAWIAQLLSALFGSWLGEQNKKAEAETVGTQREVIVSQEKDIADIKSADDARAAADAGKLRDPSDPDLRAGS